MQRIIVEKSGRVMRLRVRKKKKSGSGRKAAVLKKLATYLQCDSFMYAPLVSQDFPDPALPLCPSPAKVVELKKPRKEKQRFVDQLVEYLKSDVYMYAPLLPSSSSSSSASGTSQHTGDASPTRLINGNVTPQTDLSQHHRTSVYQISRSVSASRNVSVKSQLRTHS